MLDTRKESNVIKKFFSAASLIPIEKERGREEDKLEIFIAKHDLRELTCIALTLNFRILNGT